MNEGEFNKRINEWLEKINRLNKNISKEDERFIVLDKRYFKYNGGKGYSVNENLYSIFSKFKICFVGDNPGKNEKKNMQYCYFEEDPSWRKNNRSTAGNKVRAFIKKLKVNEENICFFNKCLFSTNKTDDLVKIQGAFKQDFDKQQVLVCEFLEIILDFPNITIAIAGCSKLKKLFKEFGDFICKHISTKRFIFTKHPCCSLYKSPVFPNKSFNDLDDLNNYINEMLQYPEENLSIILLIDNKSGDDNDDGGAPVPVLV